MSVISTIKIGMRSIEIREFSGEIVDTKKETYTSTTVGNNNQVTTSTESYDKIFVAAKNGEELAATFSGLDVRTGHWVSVILTFVNGGKSGHYLCVYNHNTGSVNYNAKALNDTCGPPFYNMLIILGVIFGVLGVFDLFQGFFSSFLGFGVLTGGIFYWILSRRKKLKEHISSLMATLVTDHGR